LVKVGNQQKTVGTVSVDTEHVTPQMGCGLNNQ